MPEQVPLTALVPGTKYLLEVSDCCFQGSITGIFLEYADLDPDDGEPYAAKFDFGTIGPLWGQWSATSCPPPSEGPS